MTRSPKTTNRLRGSIFLGAVLTAALGIQCQKSVSQHSLRAELTGPATVAAAPSDARIATLSVLPAVANTLEARAQRDPLGFIREVYENYKANVSDYRCTFLKQERVGNKVRPMETAHVMFMEEPFSVLMSWPDTPRPAERVLYIEGKWTDGKGQAMALVHPEPLLAKLFPRMKRPIDDRMARSKSRRRIDQFGFGNALELIIRYCDMAKADGQLKFEYRGRSSVVGRPTMVFVRYLPYTGDDGKYPDRVLVCHIDEELMLPVVVFTYADDLEKEILGNYVYKNVELNVGLSQADFNLD